MKTLSIRLTDNEHRLLSVVAERHGLTPTAALLAGARRVMDHLARHRPVMWQGRQYFPGNIHTRAFGRQCQVPITAMNVDLETIPKSADGEDYLTAELDAQFADVGAVVRIADDWSDGDFERLSELAEHLNHAAIAAATLENKGADYHRLQSSPGEVFWRAWAALSCPAGRAELADAISRRVADDPQRMAAILDTINEIAELHPESFEYAFNRVDPFADWMDFTECLIAHSPSADLFLHGGGDAANPIAGYL